MADAPWLPYLQPRARARLRLVCFPHAGGSASLFRGWQAQLPGEVEVCAVQLPGREQRFAEPARTSLNALVSELADALAASLSSPFALFGSSMGGWIAFELARELRRRGRPGPVHLFVAAIHAPHIPDLEREHLLSLDAWMQLSRARGELTDEELAARDLLELLFPMIIGDAALTETHTYVEEAPLDCPITAYAVRDDQRIAVDQVKAWERHTRGAFSFELHPGTHNFLKTSPRVVLERIGDELTKWLAS